MTRVLDLLVAQAIPYQVTGGLAARLYGSRRELADIDIDVRTRDLAPLYHELVKNGCTPRFGPGWYRDDEWHLMLASVEFDGQLIDLAGCDTAMIRDTRDGTWAKYPDCLEDASTVMLGGREVRIISRENLIRYKQLLEREVDLEDLRHITPQ